MSKAGRANTTDVLRKAAQRFSAHDMSTYSSALAFQGFFAIFPFMLFLVALLAFLDLPQFFDWLHDQVSVLVPAQAVDQVTQVIEQIRQPNSTLLSFGVAAAWWAASGGMRATMTALNVAYEVAEKRPAWLRVLLSLIYTVGLAGLMICAALLFSIGPGAAHWIAAQAGAARDLALLWSWLRWPLWLALLSGTVTLIYYVAPARRQRFSHLLPGAMLAIAAWVLGSLAFNFYLSHFANYSALYGSIGTVIAVLLYFSLSAAVLLFGAEINAVLELQRAGRPAEPAGPTPPGTLSAAGSPSSTTVTEDLR